MFTDFEKVTEVVRADPEWQAAMRKRGIADFQNVMVDAWSSGLFFSPEEKDKRIARGVSYYRGTSNNPYAHPIEGVVAYVDLNENRVYQLVDTGVVPVSKAGAELDEKSVGKLRESAKRLQILQPHGPDFTVAGNLVQWQKLGIPVLDPSAGSLILQTSPIRIKAANGRSSIARTSPRCMSPTVIPARTGSSATSSTRANMA
jgi:Cu2+-containing amine oxidase